MSALFPSRQGRSIIAHRFIGGMMSHTTQTSPAGTKDNQEPPCTRS